MVSNIFIDQVLSKISQDFVGTFSCDRIPIERLLKKKKFCIIVNLSENDFPGTHYIAIKKTVREVLYFDSGGMKAFISEICDFLKKIKRSQRVKLWQNTTKIQDDSSLFCSFYTMMFCLKGKAMMKIQFSKKNLLSNDETVIHALEKEITKKSKVKSPS